MSYHASPIKGLQSFPYRDVLNYSPVTPMITAFATEENDRLNQVVYQKNIQIARLYEENNSLIKAYEQQILTYKKTIQALEREISEKENVRDIEFLKIKQRFEEISSQQSAELKTLHSHQVEFLLKQIAQQRASNDTLNLKLTLKDQQIQNLKQSYERQLSSNVSQINTLTKVITKVQDDKNKQIRDLTSRRQLQKSRTSGLISSRRQANTFMDKQVRKLNEQVLQKTIQIQSLSRELNRQKKKYEDTLRSHGNAIKDIQEKYEEQIEERQEQFLRVQKTLKAEIKEVKEQLMGYIQQIDGLKSAVNTGQKQILRVKQLFQVKKEEVERLKAAISKLKQEHVHQINTMMKQRRKSRSNIGSSRSIISLKQSGVISEAHQSNPLSKYDSQFGGSARLQSNLHPIKQQSPDRQQHKDYSRQLADSHLQDDEPMEQTQLQRAVYHYDNLIQELKKNHSQELELLKMNEKKMRGRLEEKEHELLDILTKFSPLVKIHAGEKSLEEDRRERIERHWKADVTILEVLLRKYRIKVFQ